MPGAVLPASPLPGPRSLWALCELCPRLGVDHTAKAQVQASREPAWRPRVQVLEAARLPGD